MAWSKVVSPCCESLAVKPETLVEISLAVERFRRHGGTPREKLRLANCVADMVDAVRELPQPEDSDLHNVKLAVCFLCSGRAGTTTVSCLVSAACPFGLSEVN